MLSLKNREYLTEQPRLTVLVAVAIVLAVAALTTFLLHKNNKTVLFGGLTDEEAAQVTEALDSLKFEYALDDGGASVLVDETEVDMIRLNLISEGLKVGSGVGYELFDKSDYGMTEFAERINLQRALEGEISRTIASMPEVKQARVHLVLPQKELFQSKIEPAKAAVALILESNNDIDASQVDGIRNIVSSSVKGLKKSHVLITDSNGRVMGDPGSEYGSSDLLKQKSRLERVLQEKAEVVLEKVFGENNYVVSIDMTLSTEKVRSNIQESLLPSGGKPILTHKRHAYKKHDGGSSDGGKPYDRTTEEDTDESYATGQINKEVLEHPGKIIKLSAAIMVPFAASDDQLKSIENLLKSTIGYDETRGDDVTVARMKFYIPRPVSLSQESNTASEVAVNVGQESEVSKLYDVRYVLVLLSLVVFTTLLVASLRKGGARLSHAERQHMLSQLKSWLADDSTVIGGGDRR